MESAPNNSTIAEPAFVCNYQKTMCQESYRSSMYISVVITIVFNVLLAFTAVLGNGLIFAAYYQTESLRKPVNTILLSLAITDFLTGAVSQPLYIYELVLLLTNCTETLCTVRSIRSFFMLFLLGATLLNLSLTTLDRYIAILHSFRYLELVTNSRVITLAGVLWFVWILLSIAGVLSSNISLAALVIVISNVIFISILYFKIFREIRRLEADSVVAANEPEEVRKARERKSAKTVAIILGLLFLCFVSMIIYLLISLVIFLTLGGKTYLTFKTILFYFASTIASSNSSLNVAVYVWNNSEIQTAMLRIIRSVTRRCRNEVNP